MPVIPTQQVQYPPSSAVSLAAYARAVQVCECSFWGIESVDCAPRDCRNIWTKNQRDWVQYYLAEAQFEIERVTNYHIGRQWDIAERHDNCTPLITRWGYVVSGGTRAVTNIALGVAVNYATDPAVVGPVATTITDSREIKLYHAGTDIEIDPATLVLTGAAATFTIPRCRLVDPAFYDNPTNGWQYADMTHYATTVDIKRVYNDTTIQAQFVGASCSNCTETKTNVCIHVRKPEIGSIDLGSLTCGCGRWVELNYYSGREIIDSNAYYTAYGRQAQDAIIRLAHVKMPHPPCACDSVSNLWTRDRQVIVDGQGRALRGVCDFGPEEGAWTAWRFANAMKLTKGATL